jgi:UDP-N-acetylglucosamine 2-epimerase (non-hydrolysing)
MTDTRKLRLLLVAGARPNFVKIAPLMDALRARADRAETLLVHTGQHYDEALSKTFFDQMGIPRPDVNLEVGSASHAKQTAEVMTRFEPVVEEWKPDVVVVVGDVNSTVACALVACKLGVRVAHVEAGLRSFDRTMPEEINRLLTDAISDFLFVTEPSGVENLQHEGVAPEKIHLVGNVMIDSLKKFLPIAKKSTALHDYHLLPSERDGDMPWADSSFGEMPGSRPLPFALLTLHRPSNVDEPEKLGRILDVLNEIGSQIPVFFPVHPRTRERLDRFGLTRWARTQWTYKELVHKHACVLLAPPVGYLEFLHLMSEAKLVLTDSGGIQEETTALGVPCLTLRDNTERPITVTQGTNQLVGSDPDKILAAAKAILSGESKRGRVPDLWDGAAASRIIDILLRSS